MLVACACYLSVISSEPPDERDNEEKIPGQLMRRSTEHTFVSSLATLGTEISNFLLKSPCSDHQLMVAFGHLVEETAVWLHTANYCNFAITLAEWNGRPGKGLVMKRRLGCPTDSAPQLPARPRYNLRSSRARRRRAHS